MVMRILLASIIAGVLCLSAWSQSDAFSVERYIWPVEAGELRVHLTITGEEADINRIQAIGVKEVHPKAWAYNGYYEECYGAGPGSAINLTDDKGVLITPREGYVDFYWIEVPVFPITLVYGLTFSGDFPEYALSGTLFIFTDTEELYLPTPVTPAHEISCLALDREIQTPVYAPGQDLPVHLRIDNYCSAPVGSLDVRETWDMPATLKSAGVTYPDSEGEVPPVTLPESGSQSPFAFKWTVPPVFPIIIEYVLTIPASETGLVQVAGEARYPQSMTEITAAVPPQSLYGHHPDNLHPADLDQDWRMIISEAIQYVSGWQSGAHPINYAIRAAYLWQRGEYYKYAAASPPLCWELRPVCR